MIYGYLVFYLIIMNAAACLLMLLDKKKAEKHRWRIPEATLMTVAALGGSVGANFGMYHFHHKTRKPKFFIGLPIILGIQLLCSALLLEKFL